MAGVSFLPQLKGDLESMRSKDLYWQWASGRAVRQGKWKAVAQGKRWELFDMEADVNETNDLSKQYPEKFEAMKAQWEKWYKSTSRSATNPEKKKGGKKK